MSTNILPAILTGVGTFLFSTILQGVDPDIALVGSVIFGVTYWLGSDFMDDLVS
ncbi:MULTISPECIES: hypothetical protein [Rhizobium]|uniref:hypothetical protein n=1 Tax=Rhizobium TaxID=379 RepID=UPI0013EEC310|nr:MULTISPECIES: hypothetical protein [Rhizobium]